MSEPVWMALLAALAEQQPAPPQDDARSEIIVTGERIPRTLRETASSVDLTSAERIEAMSGADRVEQVLEQVPNVVVGSGGEGPTIRGQDTTGVLRDLPAFLGGNRPRTTLQIDGRAVSFNEFVFGAAPLWDVERIEVFRTPQTTTQGLNSIAGAIFVHSEDPSYRWEMRGRLLAGDFRTRQGSAVLSGPIVEDQLAFRLVGDLRRGQPSVDSADTIRGADPDHDDFSLLRFKLLGQPRFWPGSRIELTYIHAESLIPGGENVRRPFRERRNPFGNPIFGTNVDSLTAVIENPVVTSLQASTTLSFGNSRIQRFSGPGFGETKTHVRDFSIESVLDWNPDGPTRLIGGVSHLRSTLDQFIDLSRFIGLGEFDDKQRSIGVFGEVSVQPLPRTTVTAGLRYQRDRQLRSGLIGTSGDHLQLEYDRSFSAWLPKLSIAYDFTDEIRGGVLIQRAYNPGGITLQLDTGEHETFDEETLWNYEAFARANLAGGKLSLSGNLFYTAMRDAQRFSFFTVSLPGNPPVTLAHLFNVPRARSYGAEITAEWRASEQLSIRAAVGLLNTEITKADSSSAEFQGREFARSPGLTASGGFDWRPIDPLRLSAQVRHHGSYFSDDTETAAVRVESATLADARAAWTSGRLTFFGYVRNLFDTFRLRSLFNPNLATPYKPRELGVGLEAQF